MAKGSGNGCCCTSCEEMPFTGTTANLPPATPGEPDPPFSFPGNPIDLTQAFCCSCLPKVACVTVISYATGEIVAGALDLRCGLNIDSDTNGTAVLYSGEIGVDGSQIDLEFSITVIDSVCYLCLTSSVLGIYGECKVVDADARGHPQYFCYSLVNNPLNIGGPYPPQYETEWTADTASGTMIVRLKAMSMTPITRRRPCVDSEGTPVPDTNPIRNICNGCGCVCTEACIAIQYPRYNQIIQGYVALDGASWTLTDDAYGGVVISVVADPDEPVDRSCMLKIESLETGFSFSETPPLLPINSLCPHPTARWVLSDQDLQPIIIDFSCADCLGCATVNGSGCCYGYPIPRVLHCTIAKGDPAVSGSCECLPITIPLLFDGDALEPSWTGILLQGTGQQWCGFGDEHDIVIQFYCGYVWTLQFGSAGGGETPCAGVVLSDSLVCSPISVHFTYVSFCCGPSYPPGPASVVFTVTE